MAKQLTKKTETAEKVSAAVVVQSLQKQATPLFKKLEVVKIDSQEEYDRAGKLVKELKEMAKVADQKEKAITNPLNEALKETKALFKPFKDRVAEVELQTKAGMNQFLIKQEAATKKLEEKFERGDIKKVSTLVAKKEELQVQSANSKVRKVKVLKIVDASAIPREYLEPNESAIKAALLEGKKVKGCILEEVNQIAI